MTELETAEIPPSPTRLPPSWPPWMVALLTDWRVRWPAAFTRPVPLAAGFSGLMKAALRAEAQFDRKTFGMTVRAWTTQGAYLGAVARGAVRRNLDGSDAGLPSEADRQDAQRLLQERAARRAARGQRDSHRARAAMG